MTVDDFYELFEAHRAEGFPEVEIKNTLLSVCATTGVVNDPANHPGMVFDCAVLLDAHDTLADSTTLNWSASTPMEDWDGVTAQELPHVSRGCTWRIEI